jgi:hypothetical protein
MEKSIDKIIFDDYPDGKGLPLHPKQTQSTTNGKENQHDQFAKVRPE